MSTHIGLKLEPLDTLFFRDARPFGASTRAEGGLPHPRTLAGALRTRLVSQFVELAQLSERRRQNVPMTDILHDLGCPDWVLKLRFRGPWLARCNVGHVEPLVPAPVILQKDDDTLFRLAPLESPRPLPGWHDPHGLLPLWHAGSPDAKPVSGYLSQRGLQVFLNGEVPRRDDLVQPVDLFDFDERTGLAIGPDTLTGIDSMLYGVRLLVLKPDVCLYAEVRGDAKTDELKELLAGPLPLGGEGRYVRVSVLPSRYDWPVVPAQSRCLWLLSSPAPFKQAHRPDTLPDGIVRAAGTAAPLAFSGWDVARAGPEKTRFAVPAGAVYFVDGDFSPEHGSFCTGEDAAVGWGLALRGKWQ